MALASPEIIEKGLGRELAHSTEKSVRDAGIQKFYQLVKNHGTSWKELDFLRCWKGLYYCFWMSDKPLVQQELADNLASIIHDLEDQVALQYLDAFWAILASEWHNLDRIRLNKYYFLIRRIHIHTFTWLSHRNWNSEKIQQVLTLLQKSPLNFDSMKIPNSLRYHTIEVFFTHLGDACALPDSHQITKDAVKLMLAPFLSWLKSSDNVHIVNHIFSDILDGYKLNEPEQESEAFLPTILSTQEMALLIYSIPSDPSTRPKNKKMIENYLNEWSSTVGIPFTPSMTITGLHMRKIELQFNAKSLSANSTPLSKKNQDSHQLIVNESEKIEESIDKMNKKRKISKQEIVNSEKEEQEPLNEQMIPETHVGKENDLIEGKKKKRSKKKKSKLSESEKVHAQLQLALEKAEKEISLDLSINQVAQEEKDYTLEEETLIQEPVMADSKKSVTWGPKRIKPFKKHSIICSNEEAQTVPGMTGDPAPKVLKKFEKESILLHKYGSRKSGRL